MPLLFSAGHLTLTGLVDLGMHLQPLLRTIEQEAALSVGDFTGIRQVKYLWQQLKDNRFGIDVVTTGGGGNTTSGRSYERPEEWVSFLHHIDQEERSRGQEGRNESLPSYTFVAVRDEQAQAAIPAEGQRGINKRARAVFLS
jgi:hypothetical protein